MSKSILINGKQKGIKSVFLDTKNQDWIPCILFMQFTLLFKCVSVPRKIYRAQPVRTYLAELAIDGLLTADWNQGHCCRIHSKHWFYFSMRQQECLNMHPLLDSPFTGVKIRDTAAESAASADSTSHQGSKGAWLCTPCFYRMQKCVVLWRAMNNKQIEMKSTAIRL